LNNRDRQAKESVLTLDVIAQDLNNQLERLIVKYKHTDDKNWLIDANHLRAEHYTWWDGLTAMFVVPSS